MVKIEVLGSGCANCQRLETLAREAVAKLGVEAKWRMSRTSRRSWLAA
jgi:hypothetical protein